MINLSNFRTATPSFCTRAGESIAKYLQDRGFTLVKTRVNAHGGDDLMIRNKDQVEIIAVVVGDQHIAVTGWPRRDREDFWTHDVWNASDRELKLEELAEILRAVNIDIGRTGWQRQKADSVQEDADSYY